MHSLLEDYLGQLSARLSLLPAKRRSEEIAEMRAHLERAAAGYREQGQSEEEAAESALQQFGTIQVLEERIVGAWRREKSLQRRSLWAAAICALAMIFFFNLCNPLLWTVLRNPRYISMLPPGWYVVICENAPLLIAGGVSGYLFPKRAVMGMVAALGIYCIWEQARVLNLCIQFSQHNVSIANFSITNFVRIWILLCIAQTLLAILAAWAGSRLRTRRTLRKIAA